MYSISTRSQLITAYWKQWWITFFIVGFSDYYVQKTIGTGLEFDDLRHELTEWKRKYINVDTILSQRETIAQRTRDPANQQTVFLYKPVFGKSADGIFIKLVFGISADGIFLNTCFWQISKWFFL